MTTPSYRLDTVCGNLIERLEGSRRTWIGDDDAAARGFSRIAEETIDRVLEEHDALMGPSAWGDRLRREVLDTFIPRYTRLALDHNALEDEGYRAWRRGDPVARVAVTLLTLLVALGLVRVVHNPVAALSFIAVILAPIIPELRRWYFRRRYRRLLQEVVDDMGRIQDELERYPGELDVEPASQQTPLVEPAPVRRPTGHKEPIG